MKNLLKLAVVLFTSATFAQTGHIMQGVGAFNMSMGGAATAQPLDISGALQWNPAAISVFDGKILKFDIGAFSGSPKLYSTVTDPGSGFTFSGSTEDDKGLSPMPAIAYVWGKEGSKHTFGVSAFGISGFGVDFPTESNNPGSPNFNPMEPANPINFPQEFNGFGNLASDYMLLQIGFTWAYQVSEKFSIGIEPTINYGALEIGPNPLVRPDFPVAMGGTGKGYPLSDKASSLGFGAQIGMFYDTQSGFKIGAAYKTQQYFGAMKFDSKYLDGTVANDAEFTMNYPAVYSIGLGYSKSKFDLALDYRYIDYENADGFEKSGWEIATSGPGAGMPTGAVNGFGWNSINVISAGIQYKGIEKLPLRFGYTYSSNPIKDELAFFSMPASAIIKHAFQFGFSYPINDNFMLDALYHHGTSDGKTEGTMLDPTPDVMGGPWNADTNPLGAFPSSVGYDMTTDLVMIGITYTFDKK
ncbi:MAG: outer membrane protein transport protein [Lutibacter sp.]|uniref:OmpP1/FadL family transporter n=1 Tax=Lutibacter sp. TaxID=1925666 RepID=UPI00385F603A